MPCFCSLKKHSHVSPPFCRPPVARFTPRKFRVNHSSGAAALKAFDYEIPASAAAPSSPYWFHGCHGCPRPIETARPNIYEDVTVILISGLELISRCPFPRGRPSRGHASANINASTCPLPPSSDTISPRSLAAVSILGCLADQTRWGPRSSRSLKPIPNKLIV